MPGLLQRNKLPQITLPQTADGIKCGLLQAVRRYGPQRSAQRGVAWSSSSANGLRHHGSSSGHTRLPLGFLLDLVAEVHDCHLMGAPQCGISHRPAKGPVALILLCQFERWVGGWLSNLCTQIFGMNPLLLFQKIEIIDDEESDMISNSEVDQMSSLLDYKVSNEALRC